MKKTIIAPELIFVIILFVAYVYISLTNQKKATLEAADYRNSLNDIYFTGKLIEVRPLFRYSGIAVLDLDSTNIDYYDNRDTSDIWSFVLKKNKVEAVIHDIDSLNIGDEIEFKKSMYLFYRNGELIQTERPVIFNYTYNKNDVIKGHKL